MLKEQDRETVEDRADLLKCIAKLRHKEVKLLGCDILEVEPNVKRFELTFHITQEPYSEAVNKFLDVRNKRIDKVINRLKIRELKKGEEITCSEEEKISKKQIKLST